MTPKQAKALSNDLQKAVGDVLVKHDISLALVEAGVDAGGNMIIKIMQPKVSKATGGLTSNAVARYKAAGAKLGLPALGTDVKLGGDLVTLRGLSTDGKRVKVQQAGAAGVVDAPIADVLHAVSMMAAAKVQALDAEEAAQPLDQIDPSVANLLGAIASKPAKEGPQA